MMGLSKNEQAVVHLPPPLPLSLRPAWEDEKMGKIL